MAHTPGRVLSPAPAPPARTVPIGVLSRTGGQWTVDWERAHADAQKVLDAIDFSKRDIVIWVPGSDSHGPQRQFEAAVRDSYQGDGSNLVSLEYEATWELRRSVPTGVATLKLVLEGIRARGGTHRLLVAGESQGAWIAGEIAADPDVGSMIDRAVLLGHPWLAAHHYDAGQDPRVRVINHYSDPVAMPIRGDVGAALEAIVAIHQLNPSGLGAIVRAVSANPRQGALLVRSVVFSLPLLNKITRDPHNYSGDMSRAVEYLRHGSLPFSAELQRLQRLQQLRLLPTAGLFAHASDEDEHRRLQHSAAIAAYDAVRAA